MTGNNEAPPVRQPSERQQNYGTGCKLSNIKRSQWNGRGQHASCFNQVSQSAGYKQDTKSVSLTVCGGSYGGGSECLVVDALRKTCFNHSGFAKYTESEVAETLRAAGGDLGGGSENLVLHAKNNE